MVEEDVKRQLDEFNWKNLGYGRADITVDLLNGNKTFRQKKFETFRQIFFAETSAAMFLPKRLLPKRPVPLSDMSPFPLVPRGPLGPLICPSW